MPTKLLNTYPIDTDANIKAASAYFEEHEKRLSSKDRIQFAQGLAEVQYARGETPSEKVAYYAHAVPRNSIEPAIRIRDYLTGGQQSEELAMIVKEASALSPMDAVALLDDFDHAHGLARRYDRCPDPFLSVFVHEKIAEAHDDSKVWIGATSDRLTKDDLQQWMENSSSRALVADKFSHDMVDGLRGKDGWDVFTSLPDPHKQVIARLVNDNVVNGTVSPGRDSRSTAGEYHNQQLYSSATDRIKRLLG